MSQRDEARLRQILFGEGAYERRGAPEPELLAELAHELPESAFEPALEALVGIGVIDELTRERALGKLLVGALRLDPSGLGRGYLGKMPRSELLRLLRRLSDDDAERVAEVAREVDSSFPIPTPPAASSSGSVPRIAALGLALELRSASGGERFATLAADLERDGEVDPEEIRQAVATLDEWRLPAATGLARYMTTEALEAAVPRVAEAWGQPSAPSIDLADFAQHLSPDARQALLEQLVEAQRQESSLARALIELAPLLTPAQALRVAKKARSFESEWWRERVLAALGPLPDDPAFASRSSIDVSSRRLRELFGRLPENRRAVVVEDLVEAIWRYHGGAMPKMEESGPADEEVRREEGPPKKKARHPILEKKFGSPLVPRDRGFASGDAAREEEMAAEDDEGEGGYEPRGSMDRESPDEDGERSMRGDRYDGERSMRGSRDAEDELAMRGNGGASRDPEEETAVEEEVESDRRRHYVNRGFAIQNHPECEHDEYLPLDPALDYYFWLEIADRRLRGDTAGAAAVIDADLLPEQAKLTVAVFGFPGEIQVVPGRDVGELLLSDNGEVRVTRRAAEPALEAPCRELLDRRLFFPVVLPQDRDEAKLRCNLYCAGVLVQSHLVTVWLRPSRSDFQRHADGVESGGIGPEIADLLRDQHVVPERLGIVREVDYTLSHTLRAAPLNSFEPHRLSVLLNDNGNGSHSFRFYGDPGGEPFKEEATIGGQELETALDAARDAMRVAAWGDEKPWTDQGFRYVQRPSLAVLTKDLARLAKAGRQIYSAMINDLAAGATRDPRKIRERRRQLQKMMRTTGLVQVASRRSAAELIPAAVLHDHKVDTVNRHSSDFGLCPTFQKAMDGPKSVLDTACFQGACPSADDNGVVCPSGFWGYRHQIGMPLSLPAAGDSVAVEITYDVAPRLAMAKWTGDDFVGRQPHEAVLAAMSPQWPWQSVTTRERLAEILLEAPHLLYFYCHGGLTNDLPYLQIGSQAKDVRIDLTLINDLADDEDLFWENPRPLVFLNGCHTTALKPGDAFNLVMPFVETANAAGVIGTEITIFEALAAGFAEGFLRRFLKGVPLGEAVRLARIDLLEQRNPLGLVYIPFALAGLTLRPAAAAAGG